QMELRPPVEVCAVPVEVWRAVEVRLRLRWNFALPLRWVRFRWKFGVPLRCVCGSDGTSPSPNTRHGRHREGAAPAKPQTTFTTRKIPAATAQMELRPPAEVFAVPVEVRRAVEV
ncbi:MAG: hypothetical protein RLZZ232_2795, partial [Planctomycetota bacterium]